MGAIAISFGLACAFVAGLNMLALNGGHARYGDAAACSGLLTVTWAVSNIVTMTYEPPLGWMAYPVMDAAVGALVMWMWLTKPTAWKIVLAGLFLLECVLHVAFWLHRGKPYSVLYAYTLTLNLIFAAQLLTVAFPGGSYVGARIGDLFSGPVRAHGLHSTRPYSR